MRGLLVDGSVVMDGGINAMTMCLFSSDATIERRSSHYILYKLTDDPSPPQES